MLPLPVKSAVLQSRRVNLLANIRFLPAVRKEAHIMMNRGRTVSFMATQMVRRVRTPCRLSSDLVVTGPRVATVQAPSFVRKCRMKNTMTASLTMT